MSDEYEDGVEAGKRIGRMEAFESNQKFHAEWLKHLDKRMQIQERITYGLLGAVAIIQFWPSIVRMLENAK